jgi:hypothetical protein
VKYQFTIDGEQSMDAMAGTLMMMAAGVFNECFPEQGVARRFVQNRTLSRLATVDGRFANERLRNAANWTADRGIFSFKTLFQN